MLKCILSYARLNLRTCLLIGFCASVITSKAQFEEKPLAKGTYISEQLAKLALEYNVTFYFRANDVAQAESFRVPLEKASTLEEAISMLSLGSDIVVVSLGNGEYVAVPDAKNNKEYIAEIYSAGKSNPRMEVSKKNLVELLGFSQNKIDKNEALLISGEPLYRAFDRIGARYGVNIYYHPDDIPFYSAYVPQGEMSLIEIFNSATVGTNLLLVKYSGDTYVVAPISKQDKAYATDVVEGWKSGRYRSLDNPVREVIEQEVGTTSAGEDLVTISGLVVENDTNEPVIGAIVYHQASQTGTTTDVDGRYELKVPLGVQRLEIRMLGFESQPLELSIRGEGQVQVVHLYTQVMGFDEVVVSARSEKQVIQETVAGIRQVSKRELKLLPVLSGDVDILQALLTTAGVAASSEGSAAVSVRGGGLDQNLVLQNGMPVLYPAHALGFYPLFNPDFISGVKLYRGYIPAHLGGRAASVIDVDWKTADMERWHLNGSGGLLTSRLTVEGPIVKDKVSLILGGRFSHTGYILRAINNANVSFSKVNFSDLSGQLTGRWRGGKIDVQGTYATDFFRFTQQFGFEYTNWSGRIEVRQRVAKKTYARAEVVRSAFNSVQRELRTFPGKYMFESGLQQDQLKASIRHDYSRSLSFEVGLFHERFNPQGRTQVAEENSSALEFSFADNKLQTSGAYSSLTYKPTEQLTLEAGLRFSASQTVFPDGSRNIYTGPPALAIVEQTLPTTDGETFALPTQLQPRLSISYSPAKSRLSYGLSYSKVAQQIHQLSPTITPTPVDIFFVSSPDIPITSAEIYSVSLGSKAKRSEQSWGYEGSLFYRKVNNINVARQGRLLKSSAEPEQGVYTAPGYSAGFETSVSYVGLKSQLTLSYAYSRSFIEADRRYPEMNLVPFNRISSPTDLPQQININYVFEPSGRAAISAGWTYTSGRPFTSINGLLLQGGSYIPAVGQPFADRLPPTHRLDVGLTIDNSESKKKGLRAGFGISLYNAYGRQNPYLAYYAFRDVQRLRAFQLAIIGSIIPSLNINIQWD